MNEEQFSLIKNIMKKYHETKLLYNFLGKNEKTKFLYDFYRDVEIAYYSLDKKERFYFYNEFINNCKKNWWEQFYSDSEYKQISNKSCTSFLSKFNEVH